MRLLIIAFFVSISNWSAGQVSVSFDFSNADATIALLKAKSLSQKEITSFVSTPQMKALTKKIKSSDSSAVEVLRKLGTGQNLEGAENDFQYSYIKDNLAAMEEFVNQVKSNKHVIEDTLQSFIPYIPAGKKMSVVVSFILGGYSGGFTFGGADTFYVALHHYQFDVRSVIATCQHELFHNIQSLYSDRMALIQDLEEKGDLKTLNVFFLAHNLFYEGSAEYVADLDRYLKDSPNTKSLVEHANVNKARMEDNFYLVERLLLDAHENPEKVNLGNAFSILYDWNWNNPGYAMGKYMMKAMVKEKGAGALSYYLSKNPLVFIQDYIEIAKTKPALYPFSFSENVKNILTETLAKIDQGIK